MPPTAPQPTVAVAGGGLAGLAAACALATAGFRVTVFEKRPFLGGRASSYQHPGTGEVVDNCQHVLFRTCTNLINFYERIGVDRDLRWYDEMTFVEPGGRAWVMRASALPAPLHTAPSFLHFSFLTAQDKFAIARAMVPLTLAAQKDTGKSFADWLQQHGQTSGAIERFWKPILISALSEELDRISISAAAQVVRESMKSPEARHMGVPTVPLTMLYDAAGDYIRARGGELQFRATLDSFHMDQSQVRLDLAAREAEPSTEVQPSFDYLVLALPFDALDRVLPQTAESAPLREQITHFENSPITGVHLWFDRQISDLDHAVLLDRTIQWMFHKSRIQRRPNQNHEGEGHDFSRAVKTVDERRALAPEVAGSYIELVISSSKSLIDKSRAEIIDLVLAEVREFFPAARAAKLVKSTVIKELHATYSPRPGIDAHRPAAATAWPRVFLAGDWTATGWPATMEGAVRSGHLAAEALTRAAGIPQNKFLVPDLPPGGLMRLFS
ncbi:MAG TPA: hydroxysqualene dehydroxylase HpnE [Candidatus Sulfotelmatobacter sp.]|nr:hydroxysqualene dehydroxylase HpnE [Candidatus Sulfotelmatobacter sp.]